MIKSGLFCTDLTFPTSIYSTSYCHQNIWRS